MNSVMAFLTKVGNAIEVFLARLGGIIGYIMASKYKGAFLSAAVIISLIIIKRVTTKAIETYIRRRAFKEENVVQFMTTWKYIWTALISIMGIIALSGSMKVVGISAGFMGTVLGWSLQAPITGIAAWLMIILKRPFRPVYGLETG